jgi:prophage maintenance system killer protein
MAAALYLALNDRILQCTPNEADWFTYQVVVARLLVAAIASWFNDHTRPKQLV